MAKYVHSGGGRYRPTGTTGGMRAAMAAGDAIERVLQERLRRARDNVDTGQVQSSAQTTGKGERDGETQRTA